MSVTEPMKTYAQEKIDKLNRYEKVTRLELTLNTEGERHIAEAIATTGHGKQIVIMEQTQDMYASIDGALDRMERQLRKQKEKIKKAPRRSKRTIGEAEEEPAEE